MAIPWITVTTEIPAIDKMLAQDSVFQALGSGEQECILLAHALPDAVLLMSDNKTRQFARSQGVTAANIPAFLLACKMAALVSPEQMVQIINDLKTQDYYAFRPEIRRVLLE